MSQYSQKAPVLESLFNKAAGIKACIFITKEIPAQVFPCEYQEIFKDTYFEAHLHTAASNVTLESDCLGLFSGELLSKPSELSKITKTPVVFKPEL